MINPYAEVTRPTGAFVKLMWKEDAPLSRPFTGPGANTSMVPADTSRVMAALFPLANVVPPPALELIISSIVDGQISTAAMPRFFPGEGFGPTSLPRGNGRSTEVVFDHADAQRGLDALIAALRAEGRAGRHLFGVVGVRFVPRSNTLNALLGMNQRAQNVFVEIGSLRTQFIGQIHQACWQALRDANVPFTCHWGQESQLSPQDVITWYGGANVAAWQAARASLLPTPEQKALFTNPLLQRVGLI